MNARLDYLRSISRSALLKEIHLATQDERIRLWEQVGYGDMYEPIQAGEEAAAALGVQAGEVIGYVLPVDAPMGSAIGDLMNAVPQAAPPYPDPFLS